MAVVIPFQDVLRARRRQEERACAERCVHILQSSLHLTLAMMESAAPHERTIYARRVRQLSELLEYVVQSL